MPYKDIAERREHMRRYMAADRRLKRQQIGVKPPRNGTRGLKTRAMVDGTYEAKAIYNPHRDGYPEYASPYAQFLGEPPIGRRELLERNRE